MFKELKKALPFTTLALEIFLIITFAFGLKNLIDAKEYGSAVALGVGVVLLEWKMFTKDVELIKLTTESMQKTQWADFVLKYPNEVTRAKASLRAQ